MNSIGNVTVVGLTGQSGAGKTTVCEVFRSNSFSIINADTIAREVTQKGTPCLRNIGEVFPECIDSETQELDRKKTAQIVFNDRDLLKLFNSIMYPYITTKILADIRNLSTCGVKYVLLDAPTLFESRADDFCNYIVSVVADEEIRLKRITERDGISDEMARSRFSSQNDDNYYISRSDLVITNNSDLEELKKSANEAVFKIKEMFHA